MHNAFLEKPQRGWIRPDEYDNSALLNEINELGKVKPKAFQTIIAYR